MNEPSRKPVAKKRNDGVDSALDSLDERLEKLEKRLDEVVSYLGRAIDPALDDNLPLK